MANEFIRGLPAQNSPLNSAEIRNNFQALDERIGKIEAHATVPASKSITTDGGTVYFNGRIPIEMASNKLDLGDEATGVSAFVNIGYFKDILIVARVSFDSDLNKYVASTYFIEGPEKSSSVYSVELIPLRSTDLPIARFVVRHNGISLITKGQIEPISQADIIDQRNYLDIGGIEYFSATVGDRLVSTDAYGALLVDGYGAPVITGQSVGSFVGFSNDIHPIQQAIDSLELTGGTILIKKGTYYIESTISIPSNVKLIGEGKSTVIQALDVFSGPMFEIAGDNSSIESIYLLGTYPNNSTFINPIVNFTGATQGTIKDCIVENSISTGVNFDPTSSRNTCTNCFFSNNQLAVKLETGSTKNLVALNQFKNNTTALTDLGTGNISLGNVT